MINFGKSAAALSALALIATPVVASAAPAGASAQRLSLANAPVARTGAKVKKSSKAVGLPIILGAVVLGVGVAAAAGAFDSDSN